MTKTTTRLLAALALAMPIVSLSFLAGCDSNPDAPTAPAAKATGAAPEAGKVSETQQGGGRPGQKRGKAQTGNVMEP